MNERRAGYGGWDWESNYKPGYQVRVIRVDRQGFPTTGLWIGKQEGSADLHDVTVTDLGAQCQTPARLNLYFEW